MGELTRNNRYDVSLKSGHTKRDVIIKRITWREWPTWGNVLIKNGNDKFNFLLILMRRMSYRNGRAISEIVF
jgi:hypothetical protein